MNACAPLRAPLLCVLPVAAADADSMLRTLSWMGELGGCRRNPALLVAASDVGRERESALLKAAGAVFASVDLVNPPHALADESWPRGANWLFRAAAEWVGLRARTPFWWHEADNIPLSPDWLEYLEHAYYASGKTFLGTLGPGGTLNGREFGPCVNGGAVYPGDTWERFAGFDWTGAVPWDIWMTPRILNETANSPLVQHFFGEMGLAPTFRDFRTKESPRNVLTMEQVRREALVFHRNKDGTLIGMLRRRRETRVPSLFHSGDLGDIIYSLLFVSTLGDVQLILGPDPTVFIREQMHKEKFDWLAPLLRTQPWIKALIYMERKPGKVDYNLNEFRTTWFDKGRMRPCLFQAYSDHFHGPKLAEDQAWLDVEGRPIAGKPVVIARSPRFQNPSFNWAEVARTYSGRMVFVGFRGEYDTWVRQFGKHADYIYVSNALEMARIVAGAELFIGNQSFPMALALATGTPVIQETFLESPDCVFERPNARYSHRDRIELPELGKVAVPKLDPVRSNPCATISIACFNRLDLTKRCVQALYEHTPPFKLVVTDNASTDGTGAWLEALAAERGNVVVVRNSENLGFKDPHNKALTLAEGPFFCVLNNDTVVSRGWWERVEGAFYRDPKVAIVGNSERVCSRINEQFHGYPAAHPSQAEYVEGSLLVIRTHIALELGLFDEHLHFAFGEDSDLSLRVREAGHGIALVCVGAYHTGHETIAVLDAATRAKLHRHQEANHAWLRTRWGAYLRRRNFEYRVLVRRMAALGDVIDTTPVVAALKRKWPYCRVQVETLVPYVFAGNPHVEGAGERKPAGQWDYVFDLDLAYERRPEIHTLEAYADVCGVKLPVAAARLELYPGAADEKAAVALLPPDKRQRTVCLHMGPTQWKGKDWLPHLWQELVERLRGDGWRVAVVGTGPWRLENVIDLQGKTSVQSLYCVLRNADLFVGVDSGPSHVAQAAHCPSVVLFGTTRPDLKLMRQPRVLAVQADRAKVPCVGEHHRLPPPVTVSQCDGACMRAVTVGMVEEAVKGVLA